MRFFSTLDVMNIHYRKDFMNIHNTVVVVNVQNTSDIMNIHNALHVNISITARVW